MSRRPSLAADSELDLVALSSPSAARPVALGRRDGPPPRRAGGVRDEDDGGVGDGDDDDDGAAGGGGDESSEWEEVPGDGGFEPAGGWLDSDVVGGVAGPERASAQCWACRVDSRPGAAVLCAESVRGLFEEARNALSSMGLAAASVRIARRFAAMRAAVLAQSGGAATMSEWSAATVYAHFARHVTHPLLWLQNTHRLLESVKDKIQRHCLMRRNKRTREYELNDKALKSMLDVIKQQKALLMTDRRKLNFCPDESDMSGMGPSWSGASSSVLRADPAAQARILATGELGGALPSKRRRAIYSFVDDDTRDE